MNWPEWFNLQANVRVTGSCISIMTASSSLSTFEVCASLMLPVPMSPAAENFTPSLVQQITTDSPNWERSLKVKSNFDSPMTCKPDNPLEFSWWHLDHRWIIGLGDAKMFLVQVHQLHLVVWDLLLVGTLKHEGHSVPLVLSLHSDNVVICSAPATGMHVLRKSPSIHTSESCSCWRDSSPCSSSCRSETCQSRRPSGWQTPKTRGSCPWPMKESVQNGPVSVLPGVECQCRCSPRWPRSRGPSATPRPFSKGFPGQAWPQTWCTDLQDAHN